MMWHTAFFTQFISLSLETKWLDKRCENSVILIAYCSFISHKLLTL